MIQLFIGGVRSGKSAAAEKALEQILNEHQQLTAFYIATSIASDPETIKRIHQHQQQRSRRFEKNINSVELDYQDNDLLTVLQRLNHPQHVLLIECLSTWVAWYLTQDATLEQNLSLFKQQQDKLLDFLAHAQCQVLIVTGEVGCGLIGETALQRRYADCLGELNQQVAHLAEQVYLVTAGISQQIK